MLEHRFELTAKWAGGLDGVGSVQTDGLAAAISVPAQLGGPGAGTNPEELLLGAAASCYLITLGTILQRQGIEKLELTSEIYVTGSPAMKINKLVHRPRIFVSDLLTQPAQLDKIRASAFRAEQACMISKALRGSVNIVVEPEIIKNEII